jgi:hypothetical protein
MKHIALLIFTSACALPVNGTGPDPQTPDVAAIPIVAKLDAGAAEVPEAAAPLLFESDAGLNMPPPDCHAPAVDYYENYPANWCKGYVDPETGKVVTALNLTLYAQSTIFLAQDAAGNLCRPSSVPVVCATCDYTCDCLLEALCPVGVTCACEQGLPGGILLFGPMVLQ